MHIIEKGAKFAVVGYGSWATALAKVLHENEAQISWYIDNLEVRESVRRAGANSMYLKEARFDTSKLLLPDTINEAVRWADIVLLVVPSAYLVDMLKPLTEPLDGKFVLSAIKGIIPGDYITIAEYVNRQYGLSYDNIGVLTGPTHAEEVSLGRLSYITLACKNIENARVLCGKFANSYIRATPSTDIYGTEYAAILKNIYAICAGIAMGLGYGDNFLAVLVSNANMEIDRFLAAGYPSERNTNASPYLGDLLVTCYSQFSRNRTFGDMIGKGKSVREVLSGMEMVAEGYYASECVRQVNRRFGVAMPIAECAHRILYEDADPAAEIARMTRELI